MFQEVRQRIFRGKRLFQGTALRLPRPALPSAALCVSLLAGVGTICGCGGGSSDGNFVTDPIVLVDKGTVRAVSVPATAQSTVVAYAVDGDSGRVYQGARLAPEFRQAGLRVSFTAQVIGTRLPASPGVGAGIPVVFSQIRKL